MPESSKPIPRIGYLILIIKKNHEQSMDVLENPQENLTNAFGLRFVEHPKLGVPFTGGNKDTPDIGSNGTKGSNKAEKIGASSKGKGVTGGQSGSKEVTGDTTEQLKAAQMSSNHPQVPPMSPYDPKDHGEATRRQYIMLKKDHALATRLQYYPQVPPMNLHDPKYLGGATRL